MNGQKQLRNMNAGDLKYPLRVFWRAELYDELTTLENMLFEGRRPPAREPDIDEREWQAVITGLLAQIPEHETDISEGLPKLPASPGSRAVHWRIAQALSVVGNRLSPDMPDDRAPDILPSPEVLLPMQLRARLELVLGCATIPMVWLRKIDLAQRVPLKARPERPD